MVPSTIAPVAKMMYYFHCVTVYTCLKVGEDFEIRRLKNYCNHSTLTDEDEAKLLVLCLALSSLVQSSLQLHFHISTL